MSDEPRLQTITGKLFYPRNPTPDQICIEDIAHSLGMLCRFNGHVDRFYSVAQHSVVASFIVPPGFELEALLHDATEAYIGDMPTPIKRDLPEYMSLEDRIYRAAIVAEFGLPEKMSPEVKYADRQMLALEKKLLIRDYGHDWGLGDIELPSIPGWRMKPLGPESAKAVFLHRYKELTERE